MAEKTPKQQREELAKLQKKVLKAIEIQNKEEGKRDDAFIKKLQDLYAVTQKAIETDKMLADNVLFKNAELLKSVDKLILVSEQAQKCSTEDANTQKEIKDELKSIKKLTAEQIDEFLASTKTFKDMVPHIKETAKTSRLIFEENIKESKRKKEIDDKAEQAMSKMTDGIFRQYMSQEKSFKESINMHDTAEEREKARLAILKELAAGMANGNKEIVDSYMEGQHWIGTKLEKALTGELGEVKKSFLQTGAEITKARLDEKKEQSLYMKNIDDLLFGKGGFAKEFKQLEKIIRDSGLTPNDQYRITNEFTEKLKDRMAHHWKDDYKDGVKELIDSRIEDMKVTKTWQEKLEKKREKFMETRLGRIINIGWESGSNYFGDKVSEVLGPELQGMYNFVKDSVVGVYDKFFKKDPEERHRAKVEKHQAKSEREQYLTNKYLKTMAGESTEMNELTKLQMFNKRGKKAGGLFGGGEGGEGGEGIIDDIVQGGATGLAMKGGKGFIGKTIGKIKGFGGRAVSAGSKVGVGGIMGTVGTAIGLALFTKWVADKTGQKGIDYYREQDEYGNVSGKMTEEEYQAQQTKLKESSKKVEQRVEKGEELAKGMEGSILESKGWISGQRKIKNWKLFEDLSVEEMETLIRDGSLHWKDLPKAQKYLEVARKNQRDATMKVDVIGGPEGSYSGEMKGSEHIAAYKSAQKKQDAMSKIRDANEEIADAKKSLAEYQQKIEADKKSEFGYSGFWDSSITREQEKIKEQEKLIEEQKKIVQENKDVFYSPKSIATGEGAEYYKKRYQKKFAKDIEWEQKQEAKKRLSEVTTTPVHGTGAMAKSHGGVAVPPKEPAAVEKMKPTKKELSLEEQVARSIDMGSGPVSDRVTLANGGFLNYHYGYGQKYKWTMEELENFAKQIDEGKTVSVGNSSIPQDDKHLNPLYKGSPMSKPKEAIESGQKSEATKLTEQAMNAAVDEWKLDQSGMMKLNGEIVPKTVENQIKAKQMAKEKFLSREDVGQEQKDLMAQFYDKEISKLQLEEEKNQPQAGGLMNLQEGIDNSAASAQKKTIDSQKNMEKTIRETQKNMEKISSEQGEQIASAISNTNNTNSSFQGAINSNGVHQVPPSDIEALGILYFNKSWGLG